MNQQPHFDHESGVTYVNMDKPDIDFEEYNENIELTLVSKVSISILVALVVPFVYFMNTSFLPGMMVVTWMHSFFLGVLAYGTYLTNK